MQAVCKAYFKGLMLYVTKLVRWRWFPFEQLV